MLLIAENDRKRIQSRDLHQKSQIEKVRKLERKYLMLMPFIRNDDNWYQLASSECCITMRFGLREIKRAPKLLHH